MCRWFAYLAPDEECLLEDVLVAPAHSLAKQVHDHYLPQLMSHHPDGKTTEAEISIRNRLQNVDGFGVAWYTNAQEKFNDITGPRPSLYKHGQPPTNDAYFHSICANTSSTAVMAHIRAATATPVVPVNNHPFVFGRHTIMHNGVVTDFIDIKRDMLDLMEKDAYKNISGSTDSEHLAALYITFLTKDNPGRQSWQQSYTVEAMREALASTFKAIINLQQKTLGGDKNEANSLNVCVADGEQMVAFRFRNHATEQPPSLYWSNTAGITLNRKYPEHADGPKNDLACKPAHEHGAHMIIASEPTTYKKKEWHLIDKNCAVLVSGGKHSIVALNLAKEHLATAKTTQPG